MANRILREWDYDNDLNYENVYDSALDYITKYKPGVQSWREIASAIGYRMNTIGPNDMELLKDAIEDAMMKSSRPVGPGDPSITANPMSDISMNNNQNENRTMANNIIRLTEGDLHRIVKESVERILRESGRIPADTQIGRHKFKGLKYDKNGNPIYTHPSKLDDPEGGTLSDDDLKAHGWKFSSKHGLHGQIQDPTRLPK